ncbi:hypothetical protein SJAG_00634 [Schizosaccharomyces japonicus yFS275]|uniref:HMG box domain-containing protein n=1 Tax=Schizosaccharomyces japonicus (strain yFS275 / FY16936) TaxID=402676 RepID=B6JW64_SCHJY|nr:hypothetical protein SJAG_00634 [Schizosaccharomyces japonicus yFS275]EEB05615.1 hypothetical protein SJAG_00634 [Schizosaccharomyces japonicus yFS275]
MLLNTLVFKRPFSAANVLFRSVAGLKFGTPSRVNAWTLFVKRERPEGNLQQWVAALSEEYRNLSSVEKSRLTEEANRINARKQYELNRALENASLEDIKRENTVRHSIRAEKKVSSRSLPKLRIPGYPKRPVGAFIRFYKDLKDNQSVRDQYDLMSTDNVTDMAYEAGKIWRSMSQSEKAPYTKAFERDLAAYHEARDRLTKSL